MHAKALDIPLLMATQSLIFAAFSIVLIVASTSSNRLSFADLTTLRSSSSESDSSSDDAAPLRNALARALCGNEVKGLNKENKGRKRTHGLDGTLLVTRITVLIAILITRAITPGTLLQEHLVHILLAAGRDLLVGAIDLFFVVRGDEGFLVG